MSGNVASVIDPMSSLRDRYTRHSLIPGWKQSRLASASVIIMGMGALGNEVSRILAMAGVGKALLCDPDTVEVSNLSRTALFRAQDIGRLKVEAAAMALTELAPEMEIAVRTQTLAHGVGLAELRDASLVIGCLDSRSSRLQLAGRCQMVGAPYIDGGTTPWGGEVRPYLMKDSVGACYGCSLSAAERGEADVPWSCLSQDSESPVGAAIPSSALVATWMGMFAVRFLMGMAVPDSILKIDGVQGTTTVVQQERDPECPMHKPLKEVVQVPVKVTDTLSMLISSLPEGAIPYAREPVQHRAECHTCGYQSERWQVPQLEACPNCRDMLLPRTTLMLENAPLDVSIATLGIPPREILPVKTATGFVYIELAG